MRTLNKIENIKAKTIVKRMRLIDDKISFQIRVLIMIKNLIACILFQMFNIVLKFLKEISNKML